MAWSRAPGSSRPTAARHPGGPLTAVSGEVTVMLKRWFSLVAVLALILGFGVACGGSEEVADESQPPPARAPSGEEIPTEAI